MYTLDKSSLVGIPSKRSYKKLGTILEHILENINPMQFQVTTIVTCHFPLTVSIYISTIPSNVIPQCMCMCVIPWVNGCNGPIHINPNVLHPHADW